MDDLSLELLRISSFQGYAHSFRSEATHSCLTVRCIDLAYHLALRKCLPFFASTVKSKNDQNYKFYSSDLISLISINNLRQKYNAKKRKLNEINDIPVASKICKSCYDLARSNPVVAINQNNPNLTIYRRGLNSHTHCTYGCKTIENLILVPNDTRHLLLMNYKFFIHSNARMCSEHLAVHNYWSLVTQITCKVVAED